MSVLALISLVDFRIPSAETGIIEIEVVMLGFEILRPGWKSSWWLCYYPVQSVVELV